jgi:hypothetical protein
MYEYASNLMNFLSFSALLKGVFLWVSALAMFNFDCDVVKVVRAIVLFTLLDLVHTAKEDINRPLWSLQN